MITKSHIYIGLPAFNEEIALPRLLNRIEQLTTRSQQAATIIVYNDGSTDSTAMIARQWQKRPPVVLLDCPRNKGLGAGVGALIQYAVSYGSDEDILVIMDCDDTHNPSQITEMLSLMADGADVVIASRFTRGARVRGVPLFRRFTALGAVFLFKLLHPVPGVWDYTCGYRSYCIGGLRRALAEYPAGLVEEAGFACMAEVLLKLNALKLQFAEVPLQLRYDLKPTESKMGVGGNIVRILTLLVRWRLYGFHKDRN